MCAIRSVFNYDVFEYVFSNGLKNAASGFSVLVWFEVRAGDTRDELLRTRCVRIFTVTLDSYNIYERVCASDKFSHDVNRVTHIM